MMIRLRRGDLIVEHFRWGWYVLHNYYYTEKSAYKILLPMNVAVVASEQLSVVKDRYGNGPHDERILNMVVDAIVAGRCIELDALNYDDVVRMSLLWTI